MGLGLGFRVLDLGFGVWGSPVTPLENASLFYATVHMKFVRGCDVWMGVANLRTPQPRTISFKIKLKSP